MTLLAHKRNCSRCEREIKPDMDWIEISVNIVYCSLECEMLATGYVHGVGCGTWIHSTDGELCEKCESSFVTE